VVGEVLGEVLGSAPGSVPGSVHEHDRCRLESLLRFGHDDLEIHGSTTPAVQCRCSRTGPVRYADRPVMLCISCRGADRAEA